MLYVFVVIFTFLNKNYNFKLHKEKKEGIVNFLDLLLF